MSCDAIGHIRKDCIVVKIFGHEWKTGKRGRVGDVQRVHMFVGK